MAARNHVGGSNLNTRSLAAVGTQSQDVDIQSAVTLPTALTDQQANLIPSSVLSQDEKRSNTENAGSNMSRRRLNVINSSKRTISQVVMRGAMSELDNIVHRTCELDSHADTCVAGPNCIIIEYTDQLVNISAFTDIHATFNNIPIVTAATAYDDPESGVTYILILHQTIYMGNKISNTLLCPNQLRSHGIVVDDIPLHLAPASQPSTHSIYCQEDNLRLPLQLKWVISLLETRTPTRDELATCKWVTITSESIWDPHSDSFAYNENLATQHESLLPTKRDRTIYSLNTEQMTSYNELSENSQALSDNFLKDITIAATNTSYRNPRITPNLLAERWGIGVHTAEQTLKVTTQKGVRYTLGPIEKRFRTRQAQLRYRQLSRRQGRFYTDTFFSSKPSIGGKKMAQLYINDIGYTKIYPMKLKSDASDSLLAFIHEVGIPSGVHSYDAKELTQGRFKTLCSEYCIPSTSTEPYSPWQNRAEGGIRELKRHVHRKMKARNVPLRLWDFCCKWSCDVRNKTAGNNFLLEGRTPYEVIHGHTPDISSLMDYDFYEPVWYYDELSQFPEPKRLMA